MSHPTGIYLNAIANRRTIYNLDPTLPQNVSIQDIQAVVQSIIKNTPTALNSQENRAIILTGKTHKKVWDAVINSIPGENGKKRPTSARDEAFGCVVFFTEQNTVKKFQADYPAAADAFPVAASHTTGAAQINSWTALETMGLGCHLQHYNDAVRAALGELVPASWTVNSQLCFGNPVMQAGEKTFIDNPVNIYN
ncbi:type II nitroreductase [Maudiozyma humilis]|uniref:Type II nitroreductase n=1 Tax=Maudiozyma humilis TaxID=51915 RepID=A0AAV5RZE5_MAUHU|nr:type II nitroreductase [Kazachstania humilis]